MEMENLSRVVCFPCREDTIRGFANVSLLIIDEAARVPDHIYRAVRPMLAVSGGRLICLSTPWGKRGFFYDAWAKGGEEWHRVEIPASKVPRIMASFLEEERHNLGESFYRQEYECSFESMEGLVYPDFEQCVVEELPAHLRFLAEGFGFEGADEWEADKRTAQLANLEWVGGIDFGYRNPFAALWGVQDRDDVLWIVGEHYARQKPLSYHAERLPRDVTWYVDPAGAQEKCELRAAGHCIRSGKNSLRTGIQAVTSRLASGRLKILNGRCPNLLAEAGLYRWGESSSDRDSEEPVDAHNHALAALRYLIATIDYGRIALTQRQRDEEAHSSRRQEQEWRETKEAERFFRERWGFWVA
jgi:hypothetical protein